MKKYLYSCMLLAVMMLGGCSSDDNEAAVDPTPTTTNPENVFFTKFTYDHTPVLDGVHYPSWNPLRKVGQRGNQFTLTVGAELGYQRVTITFTKYGDIVDVAAVNVQGVPGVLSHFNYWYMAQDHFNFELEELDEVAGTVKGNFSGKLYLDDKDLNSDFIEISGSFYNQLGGDEFGSPYYVYAKFNGFDWHNTHSPFNNEVPYVDYGLLPAGLKFHQVTGDDEYRIVFAHENVVGVRNFSNTTGGTYLRLSKYNVNTGLYEDYNTTAGTIVITDIIPGRYSSTYSGVFNFTAVNPTNSADVIQVTDGHFYFQS